VSPNVGADLCRVTIIAPSTRVDMALPVDVPLADLLPTLLRHAGEELPDAGLVHSGWVLQRMGETPLDPARSVSSLGVRDGEILHFRPRQAQLPELAFDDVVDAIATASRDRSDRWQPSTTRAFSFAVVAGSLSLGVLALALSGPPWTVPSLFGGVLALAALIAGTALSRAMADARAGAVLGYLAVPFAFLTGLFSLAGHRSLAELGAAQLLVGCAAAMVVAALAAFGIVEGGPNFLGVAVTACFGALASLLCLLFDSLSPSGAAAITIATLLALTPLIPMFAFRLARLPLPAVPTGTEDLRRENEVVPGPRVLAQTRSADRFMTGLVGALGAVATGCEIFLATGPGWSGPTMCAVVGLALVLRARLFFGRTQRLWLLLPGLFGFGLLAFALSSGDHSQPAKLAGVLLPLLVLAAGVLLGGLRGPNSRPSPYWGRLTDILEMLVVLSIVPIALAVLNLYQQVRGLAG
jgi:type VII secretion integral membrane protein EccD